MSLETSKPQFGQERRRRSLAEWFYPLYRRVFDPNSDFVGKVERKLAEAHMPENVEMFLSRAFGVGFTIGVLLWLLVTASAAAFVVIFDPVVPTLLALPIAPEVVERFRVVQLFGFALVSGLVFGTLGFSIGFGSFVMVPYYKASERRRHINMLLPDAIAYMYALSVGGLNQLEILQAMAKADDTYDVAAEEFGAIILETEYFDTDYRTAIRNQALVTPSDELSQFLIDMLSIIHSGGDLTEFLENQRDKHFRTARKEQEQILETLELFGEMYMTLSLFPLLLVIIIVVMNMVGSANPTLLPGTIYGLIPITGVAFIVLVSTVTQDELGGGYLYPSDNERGEKVDESGMLSLGVIREYADKGVIFEQIESREGSQKAVEILRRPHIFLRDYPLMSLVITVPAALVLLAFAVVSGTAPTSINGMVERPVFGTFVWFHVPVYVTLVPLTVFYEWNVQSRRALVDNLSDELRKLASANGTGLTLLESIKVVADTSRGKLAGEFDNIHTKATYGVSLSEAFREFSNRYQIPRLARVVKLVSKAQEASGEITNVLTTAARASENQDDIERERRSRTMMQVVIIIMTYLTLLGVMAILKTQFLDVMAELQAGQAESGGTSGASIGAAIDTNLLSLYFFHAVTLQAVISGLISGYMRSRLLSGLKYVIILQTIGLLVWMVVA